MRYTPRDRRRALLLLGIVLAIDGLALLVMFHWWVR